ncbi:MAG: DUF3060 domain-containing protein [Pyrinomonadaceae bacterium]
MKLKLSVALAVSLFLIGCDYKLPETSEPEGNANRPEANKTANKAENSDQGNVNANKTADSKDEESGEEGGKLVLGGTSETASYACKGREVEFEESATANIIKLTGECKKLVVDGVSNRIEVEKVGEIVVRGVSNKVIYGEGLNGKKPKISKSGTSTEAASKEEWEKKQAK